MLGDISAATNIYIITGRTDMRKSINGLCSIIMEQLKEEPNGHSIYLFGEPDEIDVNEKHDSIATATWNYEMASLNVVIRNGYISGVEYLVAEGVADGVEIPWEQTEFGKDSQGNYDYLENIYQWEATCGSDANDMEASYHPYDDDYDDGYVKNVC